MSNSAIASVRTEAEQAAAQITQSMNSKDPNPNQGPMFDSMIKTFSQKAFINNGGDLSLAPPVSLVRMSPVQDKSQINNDEGKEGEDGGIFSQVSTTRSKAERFLGGKRPEPNDGDIENFYTNDPSKLVINNSFRQT